MVSSKARRARALLSSVDMRDAPFFRMFTQEKHFFSCCNSGSNSIHYANDARKHFSATICIARFELASPSETAMLQGHRRCSYLLEIPILNIWLAPQDDLEQH